MYFKIIRGIVTALLLCILCGCDEDDDPITGTEEEVAPSISITVTSDTESIRPGSELEVTAYGLAGSANLVKVRSVFSGAVNQADSSLIDPPATRVTRIFNATMPVILEGTKDVSIGVTIFDDAGNSRDAIHEFSLLDNEAPDLTLSHSGPEVYMRGDTIPVEYLATDDIGLYYMFVRTSGAFEIEDTIRWSHPYPVIAEGIHKIVIPDDAPLESTIMVDGELLDGSLNSNISALSEPILVDDIIAPEISVRVPPDRLARMGDTLKLWVVGQDRHLLSCLGIELSGAIVEHDSLCSDTFHGLDSVCFPIYIPSGIYSTSTIRVAGFGYDRRGNASQPESGDHIELSLEGRIRFSQRHRTQLTGTIIDMVIDDDRNLAYLVNIDQNRVDLYSLTNRTIVGNVPVGIEPRQASLTHDRTRLLVVNKFSYTVSVIDLTGPEPVLDTNVYVSEAVGSPSAPLLCVGALANNKAYVALNYGFAEIDLETYGVTPTDWGGMRSPAFMETSGNKRYVIVGTGSTSAGPAWLYDSATDQLIKTNVDWYVCSVACDFNGINFEINSILYDNTMSRIGFIRLGSSSVSKTVFTSDGLEAVVSRRRTLGLFDMETMSGIEAIPLPYKFYTSSIKDIVITHPADRLLISIESGLGEHVVYDIPIEPRP
jgi:hypothetical protein